MKLNNIDLNKILVFSQIVESGNYRLASEALNVTPSALSQTITRLEQALRIPLFHRAGKKLVPTKAGLRIHREFRRSHSQFLQAMRGLSNEKERVSGILRIGAYQEFAKRQLVNITKVFLAEYPEVTVKFSFDSPTRLQKQLESDQLDLCFSIFPSQESRLIDSRPAFHEELVLIAPPSLVPDSPTYEELLDCPVVEYYFNHQPLKKWLYLHYKRRPKTLPIRAYAASAEMVLALVEAGVGIGVVPKFLLNSRNGDRPLRVIRPSSRRLLDHIWILEKKASSRHSAQSAFHKLLDREFGSTRISSIS